MGLTVAKTSKFNKQMIAKQQQIDKIVRSIIPDVRTTAVGANCLNGTTSDITVHAFVGRDIVAAVYNWDDTGDNRQKIRDSYNEYLAKQ